MKVTVVIDQAGKVVAAHVPSAAPDDYEGDEVRPVAEFLPSEGEEIVELDLPDADIASDAEATEVLEMLQRHKDRS